MNSCIIGSGAREHAIARALDRSPQKPVLVCFGSNINPGIAELCDVFEVGEINDPEAVVQFAEENDIDLVIIGPEAPLAAGVADALWDMNISCVGPKKDHARIESSKAFTRDLLKKYHVPGGPEYKVFNSLNGVADYLNELGENYVVKFDGLMGGKGVKVAGDHLHSHREAMTYCRELVEAGGSFVIEEKLIGEEFSLMSFCDGENLAHMIPVQDHKRAFEGDTGPNTGGMGSYSDANHSLPFLSASDIAEAQAINIASAQALKKEFGDGYKGILYGGFIATAQGVKLIEYNARFGDPEAMNVLAVLETDFVSICNGIVNGTLDKIKVTFSSQATVCKYAVPEGYPDAPVKSKPIDVSAVENVSQLYYASVDVASEGLIEAGSRTVAVVGLADTISEAEKIAEKEISAVQGPLFHRTDIGKKELLDKRVEHMKVIRSS